ncbi:sensor histidine kinase [Microbacterium gallinarum]|uniref:histidine kinase n=1 Tax=Microbacterium gallinarum TaxID=2762209 RepID=A0ABR8WZ72_9MICO|nr:HAMP domain-containing sensor histidine kinase [Microbacterium gallinarum]MBD8022369.1 HAMP domain-containing histidine kinase [Microbacterium gallinarum]
MAERRRRLGIRARITSVAVAVVAVALIAGAVGFWLTLRTSLLGQLEVAAVQDATAWAEQVDDAGVDSLPDVDDDRFWQVLDRDTGSVVAASDVAEDLGPLADREGALADAIDIPGAGVFVVAADRDGGDWVVVAGRSTAAADATLASVATLLAVSVPLVVLVVGVTTWIAVGRALAPVDRLRSQVDAVTASDLSRRVDDPHTTDEVGRLARTMNGMLARLETAQHSQRRFISDASHELKSPLAVLRQYAEVALAHPERVSPRLLADTVLGEGARLERLVQGMLVLAKADENALVLDAVEVDLDDVLFAEAQRVRATTAVEVDGSGIRPVRARTDVGLVAQAVRNLVDNAVRHASGRVALSTAQADGMAVVVIEDDGPGVPPDQRERVWERFVRLDEARSRDAGGSGLGLAIVAEIARAHGGSVRLDDAALGGARFTLCLPE